MITTFPGSKQYNKSGFSRRPNATRLTISFEPETRGHWKAFAPYQQ